MAVFLQNIPYNTTEIDLTQALRPLLHKSPFKDIYHAHKATHAQPMNFHVHLIPDKHSRHSHTGKGVLTFPTPELAALAIDYFTNARAFRIRDRQLRFEPSKIKPSKDLVNQLRSIPYRDPEEVLHVGGRLGHGEIRPRNVQFMYECRDWVLSPEWEWCSPQDKHPLDLRLEEKTRQLVIEKVEGGNSIRIRYFSIDCIEMNSQERSFIIYLTIPPSYERPRSRPPREKLIGLNAEHIEVSPFTWCCIRVVGDPSQPLDAFSSMLRKAKIPVRERVHQITPRGRYSSEHRRRLQHWLSKIEWEVAFQIELIYREILLDPAELLSLRPLVEKTILSRLGAQGTIRILRNFILKLRNWNGESNDDLKLDRLYVQSANEVASNRCDFTYKTGTSHFLCYHVTVTPSRMLPSGPFLDVSNRILRLYPKHQHHFLRVSFTDEEELKFRWDRREVDGPRFVRYRVGGVLKKGFNLCGRSYEFLGYSQSALKEYTVWFVSPFEREGVLVNGDYIRRKIGTRWPKELLRCPARYAARLSQAFTATDRGMVIEEDQIELIPDIERNKYCFTDGNGSVSLQAAKAIYAGIKDRQPSQLYQIPSVFQLRLQGAKGIITVDPRLKGLLIQLRPSMVKFRADHSDVEIARVFEKPVPFFLNKPLSMILAGLGVPQNVFLALQRIAVKDAEDSVQSFRKAASLFDTHGLGTPFALSAIFHNLRKIDVPFEKGSNQFIDPFVDRCLQYAVHHVLRELKSRGRIPVPDCWKLVGTVDVYDELAENEIFAQIVRGPGSSPKYIEGKVLMAKSPTIHPGDVQIVHAIGKPRPGSRLGHLTNCVVFSQRGRRPLPNKLSGSDLDGDEYDLIPAKALHPPRTVEPGSYPPAPQKLLDHNATISDIADFIVDYINSDMLGVIATNFLYIADRNDVFHKDCATLAELHSWAVDFPKNGEPVPVNRIPYPEVHCKPDWSAPELRRTNGRTEYYESSSVLGVLFRDIELPRIDTHRNGRNLEGEPVLDLTNSLDKISLTTMTLKDTVSKKLMAKLNDFVHLTHSNETARFMLDLFSHFATELAHIAHSYSLTMRNAERLSEEEVFIGTIIAQTSQPQMRRERTSAMREAMNLLIRRTREELEGDPEASINDWANRGWMAWKISISKQQKGVFGAKSFGFVALRALFDVLHIVERG